jgi:hypothetical protein
MKTGFISLRIKSSGRFFIIKIWHLSFFSSILMFFKTSLEWEEMLRKMEIYHILMPKIKLFLKSSFVFPEYPRVLAKLVLDGLKIRIILSVMLCCVVW